MDNNKITEHKVETYAEDMAKVIGEGKDGMVKKIIHGEEAHEEEKRNFSPESEKNKVYMLVGAGLVVLGAVLFGYFFTKNKNTAIPVEKQFTPIIFNDKTTFLEVAGRSQSEIVQSVVNVANASAVKESGVEGIYLTENKSLIGLQRFVTLTKSSFTPDPNPLLVSDNFLMGVVNTKMGESMTPAFFMLIKVRGTADIFETLRSWEGKMLTDLHAFVGVKTGVDTNYLFVKNFEDGIVENKNARVLYDLDRNIVLAYVFADNNSVVITESVAAAREIILRLSASQTPQ